MPGTTGSATNLTYTGDNGIDWTITGNRNLDQLSDMRNLTFPLNTVDVQPVKISGGIGSFSVQCLDMAAVGNDGVIELLVNGKLVGNMTHNGEDINTLNVNDIDIDDDFTIALRNTSPLLVDNLKIFIAIDNISWTSYTAPITTYQYRETFDDITLDGWGSTFTGNHGFGCRVKANYETDRLDSGKNIFLKTVHFI